MKKNLLFIAFLFIGWYSYSASITVTPENYVAALGTAANGDVLMLDAGTYSTAVNFPVGKTITLQKLASAATMPLLTFAWATSDIPVAGSGLILDGLEISLNNSYYIQFPANSVLDKFIFRNCVISNINRCLVRASNSPTTIGELTIDNCIIKDCGSGGYSLLYSKAEISTVTIKNTTLYNYQSEGLLLSQTAQTNTLVFNMINNTLYQCGKDGIYSWCTIVGSGASSTYNISNNIICKPFSPVSTRTTIAVPAGSGTVTCKNNLVIDYPNFSTPPAAGWDAANNTEETGTNYFKDAGNFNFTLVSSFALKGTDGKFIGAPRWWPSGSYVDQISNPAVKIGYHSGLFKIESAETIGWVGISDLKGNKLFSKNFNSNQAVFESPNLDKGVYLVNVRNSRKNTVQKISIR